MIISIDAGKAFVKIQFSFMIKKKLLPNQIECVNVCVTESPCCTVEEKNCIGEITIKKKKTSQTRNRGKIYQLTIDYLQKLSANIMFNGEKLNTFPLRSGAANCLA